MLNLFRCRILKVSSRKCCADMGQVVVVETPLADAPSSVCKYCQTVSILAIQSFQSKKVGLSNAGIYRPEIYKFGFIAIVDKNLTFLRSRFKNRMNLFFSRLVCNFSLIGAFCMTDQRHDLHRKLSIPINELLVFHLTLSSFFSLKFTGANT